MDRMDRIKTDKGRVDVSSYVLRERYRAKTSALSSLSVFILSILFTLVSAKFT
jgi:hypothetical protein